MEDNSKAGIMGDLEIGRIHVIGEFWTESYLIGLMHAMECRYSTDIIRVQGISDIVVLPHDGVHSMRKVLVKWYRRPYPLTDEELLEKWGRDVTKEQEDGKEDDTLTD